jgi:hypothetical protein
LKTLLPLLPFRLKKEKEEERQHEEAQAKYTIESLDVSSGETHFETLEREQQVESSVWQQRKRSSETARKTKETER